MKKILVLLVFSTFLTSACSGNEQLIDPWIGFSDSGVDPRLPCDPSDMTRLRSDIENCGACDNRCDVNDADRCSAGECLCGDGPPCHPFADCIYGNCVISDQFTECLTADDCQTNQDCIFDPYAEVSYCIDVCEFSDACMDGHRCIEGACTFVQCVPENCDGFDNDCDGIIDESGSAGPLSRWCYSGPDIDRIELPCRRGVQVCQLEGVWSECDGEIPPVPETGLLGCDGFDNDCDGCVDGVYEDGICISRAPSAFDILFVIDQSGSMNNKIEIVRQAVRLFSTRLSASIVFRWGIIRVPSRTDGRAELYLNLTDFTDFETNLRNMSVGSGGIEPQWDAIYEAVTSTPMPRPVVTGVPEPDDEAVAWRPDATRIIILFTDEKGQTTRALRGLSPVMEADMCAAMSSGEVFIPVVTMRHQGDFDDCSYRDLELPSGIAGSGAMCGSDSDCSIGGEMCAAAECVTEVVTNMANSLDTIIADPCR